MRFSDVENQLSDVALSGAQLVVALCQTGEWWKVREMGTFSAGGILLHIGQAARFNLLVVRQALATTGHAPGLTDLEQDSLTRATSKLQGSHLHLGTNNVVAAESQIATLDSPHKIGEYLANSYGLVRRHLASFSPEAEDQTVAHPLVTLKAPAPEFLYRQVIHHSIYHFGQVNALLKNDGYTSAAPHLRIFGNPPS